MCKKLLNKSIYFNTETLWDLERKESEWKQALNTLKFLKKQAEKFPLLFEVYKLENGKEFTIEITFKENFGAYKKGWHAGHSNVMLLDKLPLFDKFINKNI